jgi:hypothetical protein
MHRIHLLKQLLLTTLAFFFLHTNNTAQGLPPLPPNQLVLPTTDHDIPFVWKGDSMNATWNPHAALLLPVTLPNCPRQFYMQFDLGAPSSVFYKRTLDAISKLYPNALKPVDSSGQLLNYTFKVGPMQITATAITLRDFGNATIASGKDHMDIIGTIGTDFIENKIAVINYPQQKLLVAATVPPQLQARVQLTDMVFARRSILLPSIIKGKRAMLYFDTGSSAFELLTDKPTVMSLAAAGAVPSSYPVKSWGRTLTANTLATNDSIQIAGQHIPLLYSTYIEGASDAQVNQMLKMGIGGMTGNKLFLGYLLVLDTKNKKFGLLKP